MANKSIENLETGDLVVYKLKGKSSKSYGEYLEMEFSSKGDIVVVKDMLENFGKIVKIPVKNITTVMDNFLKEAKELIEPKSKILKEILKLGSPLSRAEHGVTKDGIVKDTPFYNMLSIQQKNGEEFISFTWNMSVFDEEFTRDDCIKLDGFIVETPMSVDIVISQPFSKRFVFTKVKLGNTIEASARQLLQNLNNMLANLYAAIKEKYMEFSIKHNKLLTDCEDYVDAYKGYVFVDINEAEEAIPEMAEQTASNKSFILTKESKTISGIKLYRIEAVNEIPSLNVKKGDKGGFIEKEQNLDNFSWVADNAIVYNNAKILHGALVKGNASIHDSAIIDGNKTIIDGEAEVSGNAHLQSTILNDFAKVSGNVIVSNIGTLKMSGKASLSGKILIDGNAIFADDSSVIGIGSGLYIGSASFADNAEIEASGQIGNNLSFIGKTNIFGTVNIKANAKYSKQFTFKDIKTSGKFIFKGEAFDSLNKFTVTPDDFGNKDLVGDTTITTSQDLLKVLNEANEKSPIEGASNLKRFIIEKPKQWTGPIVKEKNLTTAQIKYLRELRPIESIDSDTDPTDIEMDNSYAKESNIDITEEAIAEVLGGELMFYMYFGDEDQIQYMIRLDPKIFK